MMWTRHPHHPLPRLASRHWLLLAVLVAALLAGTSYLARAAEEILDFSSTVRVQHDGALLVTETIRVRAEGRQIRRGIYRDFPLRFRRADGGVGQVGLKVLKVLRDGQPENWFVKHPDRGVARIYIGRQEAFLPPGTYTYAITYRTTRQLRFFNDYDELYWNVTGNFWIFPIRHARVEVALPSPAPVLRHAVYTGRLGEQGRDARVMLARAGRFVAETNRPLMPGEGFTIAIAFPSGVVKPPGALKQFWWQAWDLAGLGWLAAGVALLAGYFGWAWWRYGRDPSPGIIVPRWEPPQGISPAIAAALMREAGEIRAEESRPFIAALLSLATKGFVSLKRDEAGRLSLRRLKPVDNSLPPGERLILSELLDPDAPLTLDKSTGKRLRMVLGRFQEALEREYADNLYQRNRRYFLIGLGILALIGVGLVALATLGAPYAHELLLVEVFLLIPVVIIYNLLREVFSARGIMTRLHTVFALLFVGFILLAFLNAGVRHLLAPLLQSGIALWPLAALLFAPPLLLMVFQRLLPRPTREGRRVMDEIEGLRMFIETAERQRLNRRGEDGMPEMSIPLYEKLLPWAVALDVEEPWTRAFRAWLATAAAAGGAVAATYQPRWYEGDLMRDFSSGADSLSSSLAQDMAASMAASMPSHSSSGSFGGGSSGGGGGGGGGGGW